MYTGPKLTPSHGRPEGCMKGLSEPPPLPEMGVCTWGTGLPEQQWLVNPEALIDQLASVVGVVVLKHLAPCWQHVTGCGHGFGEQVVLNPRNVPGKAAQGPKPILLHTPVTRQQAPVQSYPAQTDPSPP